MIHHRLKKILIFVAATFVFSKANAEQKIDYGNSDSGVMYISEDVAAIFDLPDIRSPILAKFPRGAAIWHNGLAARLLGEKEYSWLQVNFVTNPKSYKDGDPLIYGWIRLSSVSELSPNISRLAKIRQTFAKIDDRFTQTWEKPKKKPGCEDRSGYSAEFYEDFSVLNICGDYQCTKLHFVQGQKKQDAKSTEFIVETQTEFHVMSKNHANTALFPTQIRLQVEKNGFKLTQIGGREIPLPKATFKSDKYLKPHKECIDARR